jgi:hypothetical protein
MMSEQSNGNGPTQGENDKSDLRDIVFGRGE